MKKNLIILLIVLAALVGLYGAHRYVVNDEVHDAIVSTQVTKDKEYQKKIDNAQIEADKETREFNDKVAKALGEKDGKISNLIIARDDLVRQLYQSRNQRPTTSTENSVNTSNTPGTCTGVSLYAEDAEFLIREASRADTLILERDFYHERYLDAQRKVNGTNSEK